MSAHLTVKSDSLFSKGLKHSTSLAAAYPELAAQWHPTKNLPLLPIHVTRGSGAKVWWQCPAHPTHVWQAVIRYRVRRQGCPYCSGRKASATNNLLAISPLLATEWHPSRNGDLKPDDVTPNSSHRIWWRCSNGHEWQASVAHRTAGSGCPYCSGRQAAPDTSLEVLIPRLAREWDQERNGSLNPSDVRPGSIKKAWWKCVSGHHWQATIGSRSAGRGCPVCAGRTVHADNSLATRCPDLAKEWHPHLNDDMTPDDVVAGTQRKVWWQCKRNSSHAWQASVQQRVRSNSGCPFCNAGSATSMTELRVYAELSCLFDRVEFRTKLNGMECDVFVPEAKIAIEIDGGYWHKHKADKDLLKNERIKAAGIHLFRFRESNLPLLTDHDVHYQSPKATFADLRNLVEKISTTHTLTDLQKDKLKDYLKRDDVANDALFMELLDRLPKPFPGKSLAEVNPELASEWHPSKNGNLAPDAVNVSSHHKAWWICKANPLHQWEADISSRTNGSGCPFCAGR